MAQRRYLRTGSAETRATTVRFPAHLHDRITAAADKVGISVNTLVNDAVEAAVDRIEAGTATADTERKARSAYADVIDRLGGDTP